MKKHGNKSSFIWNYNIGLYDAELNSDLPEGISHTNYEITDDILRQLSQAEGLASMDKLILI